MSKEIELSLVVLCYRAEENIIPFVDQLTELVKSLTDSFEIILVGNYIPGTHDRTKEIVKNIASQDNRIKAITKPKQGMMGWDMLEGMKATTGKYICVIDGDGQFPIKSIEKCFKTIKEQQIDMVKTFRKIRQDGMYRKFISKIYNLLFAMLFPGLKCKDVNSKPKILSRDVFNNMELTSTGWFIDAEMMIQARRLKCRIKEFPITFYDIDARSSFVKFSAIFEFVMNLFQYRMKEFFIKKPK